MKLSDILQRVIALARTIQAYWIQEGPKRHPNYPFICLADDPGPPPPEQEELRALLNALPAGTIYMLTVIMNLGRECFGAEDLLAQYEEVSNTFSKPAWAVNQMLGKTRLADHLSDGLRLLSEANLDVDRLLES